MSSCHDLKSHVWLEVGLNFFRYSIYDLELQFTLKLTYQTRIIRRKIASKINLPIFTDGDVCSWVTCQILNWKYFLCFLVENLRIGKYNDTKIKLLLTIFENWIRLNNKFVVSENNSVQIKSGAHSKIYIFV